MTEGQIQQKMFLWFHNNYCLPIHKPRCVIFSVPNEGKDAREQAYKKALGMVSGVSDMIVVLKDKVLFIEVKTKIGKQSVNQKKFEKTITNLNLDYHIVRSLEEFKTLIKTK